jgi:hypothetical protein
MTEELNPRMTLLPQGWDRAFAAFELALRTDEPLLLGLDPGFEGAFSSMRDDWRCDVLPTPYARITGMTRTKGGSESKKHRVDYDRWRQVLDLVRLRTAPTTLVFEDLVGYQLGLGTNISVGTLLGQQDGFLRATLWDRLHPDLVRLSPVKPQAWKRRFGLAGKRVGQADAYASAAALLRELVHASSRDRFPDCRKKSGPVDAALLLAHWRLENDRCDVRRLRDMQRYGVKL